MKSFKEMWKNALCLGANLEETAEMLFDALKDQEGEETLQSLMNVLAEINGHLKYLEDEKAEKSEIHQVKRTIKNHRHSEIDGQVLLPMEIDC